MNKVFGIGIGIIGIIVIGVGIFTLTNYSPDTAQTEMNNSGKQFVFPLIFFLV